MNDLKGFESFLETAETARNKDVANRRAGKVLVTAREAGIFHGPDSKPSIMAAKIWPKLSADAWQQQANEVLKNLPAVDISKPKSTSTIFPNVTIERT